VINDDRVDGKQGFGPHPHRDMEIISYVLEGELAHKDSTGTQGVIRPGDVQRMSAGTGVIHSEMNPAPEQVHFLQIWIQPNKRGIPPGYEQKTFADAEKRGKLRVIASPDARDGSVTIHADAVVYAGLFDAGERTELTLEKGHAWIHVARGKARVNGRDVVDGDGVALSDEKVVAIEGVAGSEVLVFDLA
jgi:quercetin 2,3-dioxygenase